MTGPVVLPSSPTPNPESTTQQLPCALRSGHRFDAEPFANGDACLLGSCAHECKFVVGEADGNGVAARVVAAGASYLGHAVRIAYAESLACDDFRVYDKGMPTDTLTDEQYDIADRIHEYLSDREGSDYNASQLARVAKCSTPAVHPVLTWMIRNHEIGVTGRGGNWIRFRTHRHGELNYDYAGAWEYQSSMQWGR